MISLIINIHASQQIYENLSLFCNYFKNTKFREGILNQNRCFLNFVQMALGSVDKKVASILLKLLVHLGQQPETPREVSAC